MTISFLYFVMKTILYMYTYVYVTYVCTYVCVYFWILQYVVTIVVNRDSTLFTVNKIKEYK